MTAFTNPYTFTDGTTAQATQVNQNFAYIAAFFNDGLIQNDNIAGDAAISFVKLDRTTEFAVLRSAAAQNISVGTTGDTVYRATLTSDGFLKFGPGSSTALDMMLKRISSSALGIMNAGGSAYKDIALNNVLFKTASFDLIFAPSAVATADRTLTYRDPGANVDAAYLASGATATAGGLAYGTGSQSRLNVGAQGASGQAALSGGSGAPTWGTLGVTYGGTGVNASAASNGQILIGNGSGFTLATITAGSGISVTNGGGSISIAATGSGFVISTKTTNFNASDGGGYYYRLTTNDATVTMPASPADGSVRKFKVVTAGKLLTFAFNGAETINHANGVSDQVLTLGSADGTIELTAVSGGWDET